MVVNENAAFALLQSRVGHARLLALEDMPLAQQLHAVASCTIMVAVHGQGFGGFLPFLARQSERRATIEIALPATPGAGNEPHIIQKFARSLHLRHWLAEASFANCSIKLMMKIRGALLCNLSVHTRSLVTQVTQASAWIDADGPARPREAWCLVRDGTEMEPCLTWHKNR